MALLIIERGAGAGQRVNLWRFPVTIGRDTTNTVVVNDEEVSRKHLRIKQRGLLFIIEDLESRNGSFLNGDRILNSIVQNGDRILVGSTEIQFVASEPDIKLAPEISRFGMVVSDDPTIGGSIAIKDKADLDGFTPIRLGQLNVINHFGDDLSAVKEIYDLHSNILVIEDLEEASRAVLKSLGQIAPAISRAACFVWSGSNRRLFPCAVRHFDERQEEFLLSQRSFEDVISRKQGVLLQADVKTTQSGRNRLIIPMIHNDEPLCLFHIEIDDPKRVFSSREVELVQALLLRCAPSFEAMLLRREIDAWMVGMMETMIATIEAKDTYTHGHSERVSRYSMAIAEELKLNREVKRLLLTSALCHDVGKIGVPDAILKKASMLSAEEYEEMKLHPSIGAEIVTHMPNAHRFLSGVKYHHEKWDGTGYPDGLAGEDIPFFGRIVAIADAFDAMVSGRAYSGFMEQTDAVERLVEEGELFDPEILRAFVRAHESGLLTPKTSTAAGQVPGDPGCVKDGEDNNANGPHGDGPAGEGLIKHPGRSRANVVDLEDPKPGRLKINRKKTS